MDSNEEFKQLESEGYFYEKTSYNTNIGVWLYGLGKHSFVDDKPNIVIVNPHGLEQLLNTELKHRINVYYITAPLEVRMERYLNRDIIEDKHKIELVDRVMRDYSDFKQFASKYKVSNILNTNLQDVEFIADNIIWDVLNNE